MIVVDASAAISALLKAGQARDALTAQQVHVPHLIDTEIAGALRRLVTEGSLAAGEGWDALVRWRQFSVSRYPVTGLFDRIWELRDNVSAYDACYVSLAEVLGCTLITADGKLSRAPKLRCSVTVVPR